MKTQEQWIELKNNLNIESRAYINGEYSSAKSGQTLEVINPATDEKLTDIARCQDEDVDLAVAYARQAFQSGQWSESAPSHRKAILNQFADLIDQHREELALLETLDTGKPIAHSYSTDIPGAASAIRWYAEAIDKVYGEVAPTEKDVHAFISHQPIGVVAAVVPWNFPLWLACWKLGPALAAGNSVILKPSEKSSLTAIYLGQLAEQAGLPNGVFQVITGFGHEAGDALAKHDDVDCIAFTGSTRIAGQLMVRSGETNLKRVFAEAGVKTPTSFLKIATILTAQQNKPQQGASTTKVKCVLRRHVCWCMKASKMCLSIKSSLRRSPLCQKTRWIPLHRWAR